MKWRSRRVTWSFVEKPAHYRTTYIRHFPDSSVHHSSRVLSRQMLSKHCNFFVLPLICLIFLHAFSFVFLVVLALFADRYTRKGGCKTSFYGATKYASTKQIMKRVLMRLAENKRNRSRWPLIKIYFYRPNSALRATAHSHIQHHVSGEDARCIFPIDLSSLQPLLLRNKYTKLTKDDEALNNTFGESFYPHIQFDSLVDESDSIFIYFAKILKKNVF